MRIPYRRGVVLAAVAFAAWGWQSFTISAGCGGFTSPTSSSATTAEGARLTLTLTSDVASAGTTASFNKAVIFHTGSDCPLGEGVCFSPDYYFLGIQNIGLIRCLNSSGADMLCPGQTGDPLATTQSYATFTLTTTTTDRIIYQSANAPSDPGIGESTSMATTPITTSGIYSGVQVAIDFIGAQYPDGNADSLPDVGSEEGGSSEASVQGYHLLWCVNANGCAGLSGYDAALDGLLDSGVLAGDMVFYHPAGSEWYFWDTTTETFSLASAGRPATTLRASIPTGFATGTNGELLYNASFGTVAALNITQGNIQNKTSDELTMTFTVANALSFSGGNGDSTIDDDEVARLKYQPQAIQGFSTAKNAF